MFFKKSTPIFSWKNFSLKNSLKKFPLLFLQKNFKNPCRLVIIFIIILPSNQLSWSFLIFTTLRCLLYTIVVVVVVSFVGIPKILSPISHLISQSNLLFFSQSIRSFHKQQLCNKSYFIMKNYNNNRKNSSSSNNNTKPLTKHNESDTEQHHRTTNKFN